MVSGVISLKDHLHEYTFQGEELSQMSLLTFVLDTYDTKADTGDASTARSPKTGLLAQPTSGRRPNRRVAYREGYSKPGHCRAYRTVGHETLPHFMGGWFPRNENSRDREFTVHACSPS